MTDTPDTSPEAVERLAAALEAEVRRLLGGSHIGSIEAGTLRALAAERDRALEWRDHDRDRAIAAEARAEAAETKLEAALERLDASLFTNAEHQQAKDILRAVKEGRE